ncbi:MAG: ATP-binding protein [Planctomycetota bacterium]
MIGRLAKEPLERALQASPAVALLGPRQVGKTTLALRIAQGRPSLYLDLENPADLLKLDDPLTFLSAHVDKLIILDEIQRAPELFQVLRGLIDKGRREGRRAGQFLILGSASMDLLRQSSESLAGRIRYLELCGFSALELPVGARNGELDRLWLRGGFPESYLADTDRESMLWLEDLVVTYLERDVPQMGYRVPATRLRRLWTMLAHLQGEAANHSKLAANLEVSPKTVSHYTEILTDLLLVRRLEPWLVNVGKRLVKSPRFYIRDSGIVHRLLGIHDHDSLLSNPVLGKSWEGFVIENLLTVLPKLGEAYYYRTAAGAELDLFLRLPKGEAWGVEIKRGVAPRIKKGFHSACADLGATRKFVVYGGEEEFPIDHDTTVLSLRGMMGKLQALTEPEAGSA